MIHLTRATAFIYIAAVVVVGGGHTLRIEVCHRNQPKKNKVLLHKPLLSLYYTF